MFGRKKQQQEIQDIRREVRLLKERLYGFHRAGDEQFAEGDLKDIRVDIVDRTTYGLVPHKKMFDLLLEHLELEIVPPEVQPAKLQKTDNTTGE